jgi:mono/diheme cytochrome c family protein
MSKNLQCLALVGAVLIALGFWLHPTGAASSASASESSAMPENTDAGRLYEKKCAECHGKDGRSKSIRGKLSHARDLTDAEWQQRVSDERIYNSISNGKGKMPAFGKKLSEAEISSLASYVRGLKK